MTSRRLKPWQRKELEEVRRVRDAREDAEARESFECAQGAVLGEELRAQRFWKLHVQATKLRHLLWAARFRELHQIAAAHVQTARVEQRLAAEQLARIEAQRRLAGTRHRGTTVPYEVALEASRRHVAGEKWVVIATEKCKAGTIRAAVKAYGLPTRGHR